MPAPTHASLAVAAWISLAMLTLPIATGCASKTKEDILPQDGPTMNEVYDAHFARKGGSPQAGNPANWPAGRRGAADGAGLEGYTRDAADEINSQFPRLPNPDLVIYVFPHLSGTGYPVPGYSTVIPMYETVEYAMPGEKEGWQ